MALEGEIVISLERVIAEALEVILERVLTKVIAFAV